MIYLIVRRLHPHSGMASYAAGISAVSAGRVIVVDAVSARRIELSRGDLVIFDDQVGDDGAELLSHWNGYEFEHAVLLHSPLLQMDLCGELGDTLTLLRDQTPDMVLCADERLPPLLQAAVPSLRTVWLPHCLHTRPAPRAVGARPSSSANGTLCWLPMTLPDDDPFYRHKNSMCQIAAARLTGIRLSVATNLASAALRDFADYVGISLREVGSLSDEELERFLNEVAVGLCVSLSESFSYSAAELMLRGIPVLFSPALRWAWRHRELVMLCGITDPGATDEIAAKLTALLCAPHAYHRAALAGLRAVKVTIAQHHALALAVLEELSDPVARLRLGRPGL